MNKLELAIFDLDGVLVDTAKYHYLAWKKLGLEMGFDFTEEQNEDFKGVSRMACMDIMCKHGNCEDMSQEERVRIANKKNDDYLEFINQIDDSELLPGVKEVLNMLKANGVKIALGSASKNAMVILERTGIVELFDAVIDGNKVSKAKPDPEVFVLAAQTLGIMPENCVVFEDAYAGVEAAKNANMLCVGIGTKENLPKADIILENVGQFSLEIIK